MKSNTCKGPNGQFLEEYHSETAAELAAEEFQERHGNNLVPYQCRRCGYWHLTAANVRKQCMFCTDSSLFLKDNYATREEAQSIAEKMRREKKLQLYPYRCPHGSGWHLTKTDPGRRKLKGRM